MAKISDIIEMFLKDMLEDTDNGQIDIQRNELANHFNCVPSQINYVITTRFSPENGYYVESRRGGGGGITIRKIRVDETPKYLMHMMSAVGDSLSQREAQAFIRNFIDYDMITEREALIIVGATSDKALYFVPPHAKDKIRAAIFKNILASLI